MRWRMYVNSKSDPVNPMGLSDRLESEPFRTRELKSEIRSDPIIFNPNPTQPVSIDPIKIRIR